MGNGDYPLITVGTCTADRPELFHDAVGCFERYTWPNLEWVIVDNGRASVRGLLPPDPRIRYVYREPGRPASDYHMEVPELARGTWLAWADDDDWFAPERLTKQYALAVQHPDRACLLGLRSRCETWPERRWFLERQHAARGGFDGTFLCRTELARGKFLPGLSQGIKNHLCDSLGTVILDDPTLMIRRVHAGNVWARPEHIDGHRGRCVEITHAVWEAAADRLGPHAAKVFESRRAAPLKPAPRAPLPWPMLDPER